MLVHLNAGSNIEPRREHLEQALELLAKTPGFTALGRSRIYETPALGMPESAGPFFNLCVAVKTSRSPRRVLAHTAAIERRLGRPATGKGTNEPRVIDIDIILMEGSIVDEPDLRIPHPGLFTRSFFLWPLLEICPNACCPRTRRPLRTLLQAHVTPPILRTIEL